MTRPLQAADFAPMAPPFAPAQQSAAFSADGRWLAFLQPPPGTDLLDLQVFDREQGTTRRLLCGSEVAEAATPRGLPELLARERVRQRYDGVTQARWLGDRAVLWCRLADRLVFVDAAGQARHEFWHAAYIDNAELSPQGDAIVFASAGRLWRLALQEGVPAREAVALTPPVVHTLRPGVPDQVTAEEVFNGSAYAWSPDGRRLLLATFDEAEVETFVIASGAQQPLEVARYSRPGRPVATFSVALLDAASGAATEVLQADPQWPYFLGLIGRHDGEAVLVRMRRDQTAIQWLRIDWAGGRVLGTLLERTQRPWINPPGRPLWRAADGAFFLLHEDHGPACIGLFDRDGRWLRDIGGEAGHVESLLGFDRDGESLLFVATGADARERHVFCAAATDGWRSRRVTEGAGLHAFTLGAAGRVRLHLHDTLDAAPRLQIEAVDDAGVWAVEHGFAPPAPLPYEAGLVPPRLVDVLAADGQTVLHAAVYEPPPGRPGPHPVMLLVYGGPHVQVVRRTRALTLDLRAQWLAQRGWVVVKVDNRGTSGRGIGFERPLYGRLGQVEVADQCAALQQILAGLPQADAGRVAVCGWSYGGYMALRCLQLRPDLFGAAVAGAPVVCWEDYDAPYTERYMGTPHPSPFFGSVNAEGYRDGRAAPRPDGAARRLLLIHGLNDENVLFRHSAGLMAQLAAQGLPYELLLLPDERHGVRAPVQRVYLEQRIVDFLDRAFGSGGGS